MTYLELTDAKTGRVFLLRETSIQEVNQVLHRGSIVTELKTGTYEKRRVRESYTEVKGLLWDRSRAVY